MECNSWVEEGILYTSGELPADRRDALQKHLSSCKTCNEEMESYKSEKINWFNADMIGVKPSVQLDERIKECCSKLPRPATVVSPFSMLFRKTLVSVLFLAVGFGGGVYFAINLDGQNAGSVQVAEQSPAANTEAANSRAEQSVANVAPQTPTDSAGSKGAEENEAVPFNRGSLKTEGVVPVDLKDE